MPTPLRVLLARVCIGLLVAGVVVAVAHHDPRSRTITVGTPVERSTSTTTSSTTVPPSTTVETTTTVRANRVSRYEQPSPTAPSTDVDAAIAAHFGDIYPQARAVAKCESTLRASARSGPNYGLFQISSVHADQWAEVTGTDFWSSWADPNLNAMFARWLYDQQGWAPWSCRWAAR